MQLDKKNENAETLTPKTKIETLQDYNNKIQTEQLKQTKYWTKKSNYIDPRDKEQLKTTNNIVKIFNDETKKWETVKLLDYTNSFIETNKTIDEIILNENRKKQKQADEIVAEITKLQNVKNITDDETDDEKQIRKLYNYIEKIKNEKKEKEQGAK